MRSAGLVLGLMAAAVTSRTLKYAVPEDVQLTADCTLPGEFDISDLEISTDTADSAKNTTSFHFVDADTGIDTNCRQGSEAAQPPPSPGAAQRWPCDDDRVEFIYQTTTGVPGLTVIEKTCLGGSRTMEASGRIEPDLDCKDTETGSTCKGKESPIHGEFTSLSPSPPSL